MDLEQSVRHLIRDRFWETFLVGIAAGLLAFAAVRLFEGRLLTAEDFDDEQEHHRLRRHVHLPRLRRH